MSALSFRTIFLSMLLLFALLVPVMSRAQQNDLQATIRAALAGDPRTASMPQAQIDAMVTALASQAQKQGMTPSDIAWRPQVDGPRAAGEACTFPTAFCVLNNSFGFDGSDNWIPIGLLLSSLLLMFIIAAIIRHHRMHVPSQV